MVQPSIKSSAWASSHNKERKKEQGKKHRNHPVLSAQFIPCLRKGHREIFSETKGVPFTWEKSSQQVVATKAVD